MCKLHTVSGKNTNNHIFSSEPHLLRIGVVMIVCQEMQYCYFSCKISIVYFNSHDSQIPIGIAEFDLNCSLQALARCCRQIMCHMSEHRHDWTVPVDHPSVQPMTTCRTHAAGLPNHKALRDWSHMVHRLRLSTVSRNHAHMETANIVFI